MNRQNASQRLKRMTGIAMFAALAYISVVILRIPNIGGFLTFDFKDVIITVAAMFFGPSAAVALSLLVPLLEFLTVSGTGAYGLIMNVISSLTLSVTASIIYKYKKTFVGAIVGLVSAVFAVTAAMMVANLIVTPFYTGMSVTAVAAMIPKLLLPFNLTKSLLNASLTLMLYKPLTSVLRKTGLAGAERKAKLELTEEEKKKGKVRSLIISLISFVIVVVALTVILTVWHGEISFFDIFKQK